MCVRGWGGLKYRREIDGLRAVAVIPVVLFHAGLQGFGGGYVGVDVFFVISGYLITTLILQDLRQDRFSLLEFYERRARRILPALFVVIAACLPFAYAWMPPDELASFARSVIAVTFFVSNLHFWAESGYFTTAAELKPLLHTWSLAVEEQFYIVFPLGLMLIWAVARRHLTLIIVLTAVASFALCEWAVRTYPGAAFYFLPTRAWELLAGALCALALSRREPIPNELLALAGIGLIALSVFLFDESTPFPSVYALAPVGGTVLIILCATPTTRVGQVLSSRPLVGLGLISYSTYLWHQPLLAFARLRDIEPPSQALLVGLALLSFPLAYLTWRFVEQPARRRDGRIWGRRGAVFGASAAGLLVFAGIGAYGLTTGGLPNRLSPHGLQSSYIQTATWSPRANECLTREMSPRPGEACVYNAAPQVAVFGDSHGPELAYALAARLERSGIGVKQLTGQGCSPVPSDEYAWCREWLPEAVEALKASPEIRDVVVTFRIHAHMHGFHDVIYPTIPRSEDGRAEEVLAALKDLLDDLAETKNVVYLLQHPELPVHIHQIVFRRQLVGDTIDGAPRAWWDARSAYLRERLDELPPNVTVVDPVSRFCGPDVCIAGSDGVAYYFDADHLSVDGAARIVDLLLPQLESVRQEAAAR
jgi:peptidoglycan/LPS O-acetylase OafA/YrhL